MVSHITKKLADLFSNLDEPRHHVRGEHYYRGVMLHEYLDLEFVRKFETRPTDVIVAGYPKSGTTWMQEILSKIQQIISSKDNVEEKSLAERSLFLDMTFFHERINTATEKTRIMKTHVQYNFLPKTIKNGRCRVIYTVRNPKDTAVSYYHFHRMNHHLNNFKGSFNDFHRMFERGNIVYGSWYDHVKGWWSHRKQKNILWVEYEKLLSNPTFWIKKIALFAFGIDMPEDDAKKIARSTSFVAMKNDPKRNMSDVPTLNTKISPFLRAGKVGDWMNVFTPNESRETTQHYRNWKPKNLKLQFHAI